MKLSCRWRLAPTPQIIKGMIALLVTVGLLVSQAPVAADSPQELIDMRTRTSKTYQVDENSFILEASIGSIHYKDDPDDPNEQWKDIELDIVSSPKANWGWEVVKGNWHLLIKDDTTVALGKDGHWIGFRYEGIAYLDWESKEYHILQTRQNVTPIIDGNRIIWEDIFYGTDLEYIYTPDGFKENLIISQATRDWLAANPPSSYGLNNQTTYIGGYLECDWQNAYPAEDYFGTAIDWDSPKEFANFGVFWRHPVKDKIITALPLGYARHDEVADEDWVKLRHRFYKANDKHWLLFGAKVTDLNQYPAGEIIIDPTVDEQVGADGDDGTRYGSAYYSLGMSGLYLGNDGGWNKNNMRFLTVNIPQGVTIDTAYLTFYANLSLSGTTCNLIIDAEDADDAAQIPNEADHIFDAVVRTTADVAWSSVGSWTSGVSYNSPEIKTVVQEVISRGGWVANNALQLFCDDNSSSSGAYRRSACHESDSSNAPKLHIEYSDGGPSAPTVVTNPATSVEETTATLSGNITATGGENADYRGFEWDIDTGSPYSSNWTEGGSFGVGQFTHGITSLTKGELYYYRAMAHNSGGWGYGSEVTFLTKPDEPTALTQTDQGNDWITLSWTTGAGSDNTTIRYDTSGYPATPASGSSAYEGSGSSCNVTSLSSNQIYYFRAWSHTAEGGEEQYSDATSDDTAYTRPTDPTNLDAHNPATDSIDLEWTKGDATHSMVRGKAGSYPTDEEDGYQAYYGTGNSTTDGSLNPGTTYYYRAWAYNTTSTLYSESYSQDNETTLSIGAPTVTTNPATAIEETQAQLNGNITDVHGDNATSRGFEWDIDTGAPYTDNWTEGGDFGTGAYDHTITSLTEGELYYFRAMAYNSGGWGYGSEETFLTKPDEPTGLQDVARTSTQINLNWNIGAGADNTTVRYRTDQYPTDYNDGTLAYSGGASTCNVTGLSPGQIHYFRAWSYATEGGKEQWSDTYSQDTAYTLPGDPSNLATSNPQKTNLDLDWTKGTAGDKTMVRGKIGSYPADEADGYQAYFDTANSATDSGLQANTTYYYRCWAYDSDSGYYSSGYSQDTGTTTMPDAPTVTTANATDVTDTTATLNGNITDTGDQNADTRGFEWGLSTGNYSDNWTEVGSFGTGAFTHGLTLLSENTTYFYRALAHNDGGWGYGGEIDFTTELTPAAPPGTPSGLTLIDLGAVTIGSSWVAGTGNTTSFLLLVDRDDYPSSANPSLYELAYSGNLSSANLTGFDMDDNEYYFSLWGWNENGYSVNYTTASIGTGIDWLAFITEVDMETLATTLVDMLADVLLLAVVAGITIVAYWHRDRLLYVLAGLGLFAYAAYQWGDNVYIGLILIVLGLYTFAKATWGARRA